jgi:hypothetical protein
MILVRNGLEENIMIQELHDYYKRNGILSTAFTCEHKESCQNGYAGFTGPKSAFVSTGYESKKLPRLLFLSLDSGSGAKDPDDRLPHAIREQEEIDSDVLGLNKKKHWYRTHELAWYVFQKFNPNIEIQDTKKYFAHANTAKCCQNKPSRKKADSILFKNCRKYLSGELTILAPDILISQGNEAKYAAREILDIKEQIDDFAAIAGLNEKKIFWLHTYHPNYYGGFYKQRDFDKEAQVANGWQKYSQMMYESLT